MSQFNFEHLVETDDPEPDVRGTLQLSDSTVSPDNVTFKVQNENQDSKSAPLQEVCRHPLSDVTLPIDNDAPESQTTTHPVLYTTGTGNSKVVREEVVIKQSNGHSVIQTRQTCHQNAPERWRDIERNRPLRKKHIRFLKICSVVAAVLFFPLGIPAAYYAFRLQKEFDEGIMRGDIDQAQKLRKRIERLVIFAFMFALLLAVLIFAVVERKIMADNYEHDTNYMRNRVMPQG